MSTGTWEQVMDHLPQYLLPGQEGDVLEERKREKETDIIIRLDMRYRRLPETVTVAHETRDAEFMYELIRGAISVAFSSFLSGCRDHRLQPPRQITADKTTAAADLRGEGPACDKARVTRCKRKCNNFRIVANCKVAWKASIGMHQCVCPTCSKPSE